MAVTSQEVMVCYFLDRDKVRNLYKLSLPFYCLFFLFRLQTRNTFVNTTYICLVSAGFLLVLIIFNTDI